VIDRIRDTAAGLSDRVRDLKPVRSTADGSPPRPSLKSTIPPAPAKPGATKPGATSTIPTPRVDPELLGRRDRLIEKFTVMQADLGGAFYEMAIRDHVRLDALTAKAAELQSVDTELSQVERAIELERTGAVGRCSQCDSPYGPGVVYCSQCGHVLEQTIETPPAAPSASQPPPTLAQSPPPQSDPAPVNGSTS
jgi:hypothetical protein